jgi:predicted TIM-barrel fold metal-dependent hydrolase
MIRRYLLAVLSLATPVIAQSSTERTTFVDAHVHLNDAAMARRLLDAYAIPLAFAFWGARSDNASVLAAARTDPRLVPFVSVSPERRAYRARWEDDDTTLVTEVDSLLGAGFRGVGELSLVHFAGEGFPEADFPLQSRVMRGIMQVAQRRRVPIVIHCEITRLREFSALLEAFPGVTVIWAHGGYTPLVLARQMLERHPNLVYELSARTWSRHPRSPDYTIFRNEREVWPEWLQLIESHSQRILVGTDASYRDETNERRKIERVQLLLSQLTPATREAVAVGNARRIVPALR